MEPTKKAVFLIFIFFVALRISGLGISYFTDEVEWAAAINEPSLSTATLYIPHPPLPLLLFKASTLFTQNLRFIPLLFNLLAIVSLYFLAKKIYGESIARWTMIVFLISFYSILSSLTIDSDSILIFFTVLVFYCYVVLDNSIRSKIFLGIAIALLLLSKLTMVIIIPTLFISEYKKFRSIIKIIQNLYIPFTVAASIFALYPILSYLYAPNVFMNIFLHPALLGREALPLFSSSVIFFLFATPFLLFPLILNIQKMEPKEFLLYNWIIINLFLYTFIIRSGDYSRYFMICLPALALICAKTLNEWKKEDFLKGATYAIIAYFIFFVVNFLPQRHYPHVINFYFESIKNLDFSFFFPYAISSGSWFGINFVIILIITIIFGMSIYFGAKYPVIFLSIFFAFNLFLTGEYLFHFSQLDPDEISREIKIYLLENQVQYPLYASNKGLIFPLDQNFKFTNNSMMLYHENLIEINARVREEGGTFAIIYFATNIDIQKEVNFKNCRVNKEFYSKGILMGEVRTCQKKN